MNFTQTTTFRPPHYLIQVGTHTLFIDRIDGYGRICPNLDGGIKATHRFAVYLTNGSQLWVNGSEAQVVEEQAMLLEHLESISDAEPVEDDAEHPQGQSG